ncbi:hypothetical protein EW145_g4975 [Phellinidium pouzarii]|uniref:GH16 domain-containing protein n=1 Tax=Phellinidium pouzarii TaxID=167371 RepID=A0A4S4L1V0_9AGAM|nr:hypothetical protein EW145_g4975 [Phellinidium pouzarii]
MLRLFALYSTSLLTTSLLVSASSVYTLSNEVIGSAFLSDFVWETIADPTHGRANYISQADALAQNLSYVSEDGNAFILRTDDTTTLRASGVGRNSTRIRSVATYTTHVAVFDIRHMPQGCGTWPAVWETNRYDWPNSGEVDIFEGANDVRPNLSSLHTSANCTMPAQRNMTGTATSLQCSVLDNGNQGCGVLSKKANNYGPAFNAAGGGWYALERTNTYIRVFFWGRNDATVPSDVKKGKCCVDTSAWGTPVAVFPSTSCDLDSHFGENNIIINLTFCGDWAGAPSLFTKAGCPGTCVDYVNNNPSAFSNAYWDLGAVRVYEQ